MVRYLNPDGFDFGTENLDGYGISNIVVGVAYSVIFSIACLFLWVFRGHPVVKMRNVPLVLASLILLHIFTFMVMVVYTLNGSFPCQVEFWIMNIYLPIGIGLFQAQNQQLLIVSRRQANLIATDGLYKPFLPKTGRGIGGPRYWRFRLKIWWRSINEESKYQGFIVIGVFIQVNSIISTYSFLFAESRGIVRGVFRHLQHITQIQQLWSGLETCEPSLVSSWMGMVSDRQIVLDCIIKAF